jgi:hypothetical protein
MLKIASIATATLALLVGGTAVAAGLDASNGQPLTGEAAFGGWQRDKPGERRLLTRLAAHRHTDSKLCRGRADALRRQAAGPGGFFC